MLRIIDGVAYEGKQGSQVRLKAYDLGRGQMEISASRVTEWHELLLSPIAMENMLDAIERDREERAEERAETALKIAANRAKKRVRHVCKQMGANTLLTLTYRHNETDLQAVKKDLRAFVRRIRKLMPYFECVVGFEPQDRGAWHMHMGTCNVPRTFVQHNGKGVPVVVKSFDAIRAVWRSVTGDRGGNIDVQRRKRHSRKTPAQIASYLSKYITKQFAEGQKWSNRWTSFGQKVPPAKSIDLGIFNTLRDAYVAAFSLVEDGCRIVIGTVSKWSDWAVLWTEPELV